MWNAITERTHGLKASLGVNHQKFEYGEKTCYKLYTTTWEISATWLAQSSSISP